MTSRPYVIAWYGCDMKSGRIAAELPALSPSAALSRRLGDSTGATFSLALAGAGTGWEAATDPGRTMLVGVDTLTGQPIGAWLVTGPREGGSDGSVSLAGVTPEAYLDRRYLGGYSAFGRDDGQILGDLMGPVLTGGPPLELDVTSTGTLRTYSVLDTDDRTVLSAAQELMGMDGGPEWTVDVAWADAAQTQFQLVIRIRSKIGVQHAAPEGVFDLPGCVDSYTLSESYEAGKGATQVTAYGDSSGSARLKSNLYTATDLIAAGWPLWEYRWTPAAGGTDPDALNSAAASALSLMSTGSRAWTVNAVASRAPRLGTDWALGDNVRLQVGPGRSLRHPEGVETVARAWGWELEPGADRVRPLLVED